MSKRFIKLAALLLFLAVPFLVASIRNIAAGGQTPISSFVYSPVAPMPNELISFDASASYDPDGWITSYTWNFGDGNVTTTTSPVIAHSYPIDGTYTVELTATDNSNSHGVSVAVIDVSTVAFFRAVIYGTLIPLSNVKVTAFYYNGSAWTKAPVGPNGLEIKYDSLTQPNLASTSQQRFRNPGTTASTLRANASNIGFDVHPSCWSVYFKFEWGSYAAYWPNETTRVYSYNKGSIETHDYLPGHQAYWDASASTYVIRAGDIPGHGVSPVQDHPIIVGIRCPPSPEQYYLSVKTDPLGITSIPGQGWYSQGTDVTLTAPSSISVSQTTRYAFSYWDVDGTSQGLGANPITFRMNANHTATAHYTTQYTLVFSQTGLSSDTTGTVVTIGSSTKTLSDLPCTLWVDAGDSVSYAYNSPVASSLSGKRFRLSSVGGPASPIVVSGPSSVVGNYVVQFLVTFAQTGLDSTAAGTVVTVNGTAKTFSQLPFNWWVDSGSTVTYSYSETVASTVTGKQFRLTGVNCPPPQFVVTGPATITGSYCVQYKVTFAQTGLDSTATGTIVTINGAAKLYSQFPYSMWVDNGTCITYSYTSIVPSSTSGKQFKLGSTSGPSSPIVVTGTVTIVGNYVTQFLVTFGQTGLDSTATGTVVTVNGTTKSFSTLPYSMWVDNGSSIAYSFNSPVASTSPSQQFRLNTVSGPSSPFTVASVTSVTGNYMVQYQVTFSQTGLDSTATTTVVTVNGSAKAYSSLPYTLWVDNGGSVTYLYSSPVSSSTTGKQFRLNSVTGPVSPISVTGPTTVTGNYVTQYTVTFTQTGLDSTSTGTIVTINGSAKLYTDLPYSGWFDSGSSITYSYNNIVSSSTTGKKFALTTVTGPASPVIVSSYTTNTGNYKTQYLVTFDQSGVGPDFVGTVLTVDSVNYGVSGLPTSFWWDQTSSHSFSFSSPLTVNASKQYVWSSTSGLTNAQAGTLAISTSGSVTGNYAVANCVTFDQTGASTDFSGTAAIIDGNSYGLSGLPVSFYWQIGSSHSFAFQSPLVVNSGKQYVWTGTTGLSTLQSGSITVTAFGSIVGNYKTQYYLDLTTAPPGVTNPSGSGWYDSGTYAPISTQQYVYGGSRWRFAGWTTANMSEISDPSSPSTTVLVDEPKTVSAYYVHQHLLTFGQTGLLSDASGTVVTVNGTSVVYAAIPYGVWVDEGDIIVYSYGTTVSSTTLGKQFSLVSVTGPSSPVTPAADTNVTGNYKTQYYLTVSSPFGTVGGQGWYDSSTTAYATLDTGTVDQGNGTRRVFTNWNGDATGTNYAQSDPITMNGPKNAVANWKTQYSVTFTHTGLDSSATGTVVTVSGNPVTYGQLPYSIWVDCSNSVTYSYSNVSSATATKRFVLLGTTGLPSPIAVTAPSTVSGNYNTQYQVTFNESGAGVDFTGTVATVDGTPYTIGALPTSFWWDSGSTHSFSFVSPLIVNASIQYDWISTTGLTSLQAGSLTVAGSGSVVGNYALHTNYEVIFGQTGAGTDFTGTIVTVDGTNYAVTDLPVTFLWDSGSSHTFSFASPLTVALDKRYVWVSTSGLSTLQSGSLTAVSSGTVTGNFKTQYYLTVTTDPSGITSPSGSGWYDANTNATISTQAFVDLITGLSRYRFNGWTTSNMAEIADPTRSPTTVLIDEAKTVTANYVLHYAVTVGQTGVGADFTGTIVTIDATDYGFATLPATFWWDNGAVHSFDFKSPLVVVPNVKRYVWNSTIGLSTLRSDSVTITSFGNITANYRTEYYLAVGTEPPGIAVIPGEGWYGGSTGVTLTAPTVTNYHFDYWIVNGVPQGAGVNPIMLTMNSGYNAIAHYTALSPYVLTITTTSGGTTNPPPGTYTYSSGQNVQVSALPNASFVLDHWELDSVNVGATNPYTVNMNMNHTLKAVFSPAPPPPTVIIDPMSKTILAGESVVFSSSVSGGRTPYTFQWYLDGSPVLGATGSSWTYTGTTAGIHYVYLKVTDANSNIVLSDSARITVTSPSQPVGGYSVSLEKKITAIPMAAYAALVIFFGVGLAVTKRKRK